MEAVTKHDTNFGQIGHWTLNVYEGEVERERLPAWKQAANYYYQFRYGLPKYLGKVVGTPIQVLEGTNLTTTVGKQLIMDRLFGLASAAAVTRTGVGTSATAATVSNTSLSGSEFKAFDALPVRSALSVTTETTFGTSEGNLNWQELGMDNGTTLLNRIAPIGPFNKTSAVSIVVIVVYTQA